MKREAIFAFIGAFVLAGCMHTQGQGTAQGKGTDLASFPTTKLLGLGEVAAGAAMMASASGRHSMKAAVRRNLGAATLGTGVTGLAVDASAGLFRKMKMSRPAGQALGQGIVAASGLIPTKGVGGLVARHAVQGVGAASMMQAGEGEFDASLPKTPQCKRFIQVRHRFQDMQMNAGAAHGLERMVRAYDACLRSAPNHPLARKQRCGPGKYRLLSFPQTGQAPCGLRETLAAIRRTSPSVPLGPALLAAHLFGG